MALRMLVQNEPEVMLEQFGVPRIMDAIRGYYGEVLSPDTILPASGQPS